MEQKEKNIDITLVKDIDKSKHSVFHVVVSNYFSSRSDKVFMKVFPDFKISGFKVKNGLN
jgi:hypothetical protein